MHRPTVLATCFLLTLTVMLRAEVPATSPDQSTPQQKPEAADTPADNRAVEETVPPLFFLEDGQGTLRPAFGFTLEDFRKAYNQIHGLEPRSQSPAYFLKKVTVTGTAKQRYAELTVACDLLLARDGAVRIPLSLGRAVMVGQPAYTGKGSVGLHRNGGYVAWIQGESGQQQRLTLKALVPLVTVGDKTTLHLRIPSGTESTLRLTVPVADAVATSSEGTVLRTTPTEDGPGTILNVHGPRGDFELSWHKPQIRAEAAPTVLEATGEILARIDNSGIHCQAMLRVRGYNRPFDRFRVRLPSGAEAIPSDGTAQSVVEIVEPDSSADEGRVVEVRLREKTLGPVNFRLTTRRQLDTSMFGQWIELAGFEVIGATRQSGHMAVEITDDLDLLWNPQLGIQQDDDLPDSLVHEDLVAGFRYFTQPCSLLARVAPRQTRVSVEPQYLVLIDADQVQLEGALKYTVRGKKARVLDLDLGDWQYDEIGPDNIVAVDRVVRSESGTLSIPLRQPSSGKIDLTIRAHRRTKPAEETLRLTFPQPKVSSPSPAAVVIAPADRIHLAIDVEATNGLTRQQAAPPMPLPERQQTPLFYRGDLAKATLVARRQTNAQQIAVTSATSVALDQRGGTVAQRLSYKIDFEPLDTLTFELPRELRDAGALEFRIDDEVLTPAAVTSNGSAKPSPPDGPLRVQAALGEPRIGTCEVEIRFPLAPHKLVPQSSVRRVIPLVVPLDGKLIVNRLSIESPPQLQVSLIEDPWRIEGGATEAPSEPESTNHRTLDLVADGRVDQAELGLCLETRETARSTVVHRAVVQTWLSRQAREDRAIFQLSTHEKDLHVVLPQGAIAARSAIFLNGKQVEVQSPAGDGSTLRLDLPKGASTDKWLLEVHCHSARPQVLRGRCTLDLPRLGKQAWTRRLYWQLKLPRSEHIVNAPQGLVPEFRWGWNGLFWERSPLLSTADLEAWIGVPENPHLAAGDDGYLFSGFGQTASYELVIIGRSWIVLGASGAALVLGLLLIYVPASRHPAGLFVLAIVLSCTGLLYPESTLLVLQAAGLGLMLTLVAGLLERSVARRRRGLITLDTGSSGLAKDSTQTQFLAAAAPTGNSTATTPRADPAGDEPSSTIGGSGLTR